MSGGGDCWELSAKQALCLSHSHVLVHLPSFCSQPCNKSLIAVFHLTSCSFLEVNGVPMGVRGQLQEGFLSLLIFLLCSWVPSLKAGDIGGWGREELPSRASIPMETTAYNLGHLGCASVVSAVSPGIFMGVAQCCGLVDELLEDITLPRVLLDVMGPCISSCFHLPCLCSSFLREWVWSRPLGSGSASM